MSGAASEPGLKWLTTLPPQQAKVARWCMNMGFNMSFNSLLNTGKGIEMSLVFVFGLGFSQGYRC